MARIFYLALALVVAVFGIAFYVRNKNIVEFDYFLGNIQIELAILLAGAFTIGALVALIFLTPTLVALKTRISNLARKKDALDRQVGVLKSDFTSNAH